MTTTQAEVEQGLDLPRRALRWARWKAYQVPTVASRWFADRALPLERQAEVTTAVGFDDGVLHVVAEPAAIEPSHGYVVHGRLGVVDASLPLSWYVRRSETRVYLSDFPSPFSLSMRRRTQAVPGMALSLRHPFDDNYFHATVDCIGRLASYEVMGLLSDNTVVIGRGLSQTRVWRELERSGALADVRYVVQDDRWIRGEAGTAYIEPALDRATLARLTTFLGRAVGEPIDPLESPRLYVERGSGQGRRVRQDHEMTRALGELGFTSVDPGDLSWHDQVQLFRQAEVVVGVHGAALTNIVFRHPGSMHLVEIHSPGGNETMYARIAASLGFGYSYIEGTNPSRRGNRGDFDLDPAEVAVVVEQALRSSQGGPR